MHPEVVRDRLANGPVDAKDPCPKIKQCRRVATRYDKLAANLALNSACLDNAMAGR